MILQPFAAAASPEVPVNANFETIEWTAVYGKRQPGTTGLTWGYYGGRWGGISVADGTLTLTNTATNYVVVNKTTGVISVSTSATNWNDIANFYRVYLIPVASGVVTLASVEDHRAGPFGVFSAVPTRNNFSVASQAPAAATRTYLVGSALAIPVGKLKIGTSFRWTFDMTKTAAGVAASTIDVAVGTAGTTADTARLSFTKPGGTAAIDVGRCVVEVTCRGPLSASGVFAGTFSMIHDLENTGHMLKPTHVHQVISSTFDVTVASLIVGLCLTSGASDAITIQQVTAEALNIG